MPHPVRVSGTDAGPRGRPPPQLSTPTKRGSSHSRWLLSCCSPDSFANSPDGLEVCITVEGERDRRICVLHAAPATWLLPPEVAPPHRRVLEVDADGDRSALQVSALADQQRCVARRKLTRSRGRQAIQIRPREVQIPAVFDRLTLLDDRGAKLLAQAYAIDGPEQVPRRLPYPEHVHTGIISNPSATARL